LPMFSSHIMGDDLSKKGHWAICLGRN
jgi:hypothetical protein